MTPKYFLSSRQMKELAVRGSQIVIALPAHEGAADDPLAFARAVLADVEPHWIAEAEWVELPVVPLGRATTGLTGALGEICEHDPSAAWHVLMIACLATLRRSDRPTHVSDRPQWPKRVTFGDWSHG